MCIKVTYYKSIVCVDFSFVKFTDNPEHHIFNIFETGQPMSMKWRVFLGSSF